MTFESTRGETQALRPIKTPTNTLSRLRGRETEAETEAEAEGGVGGGGVGGQREMSVLDENVLTW